MRDLVSPGQVQGTQREELRRELRVAAVCRIEQYYATRRTADVTILVDEMIVDNGVRVPLSPTVIPEAPVIMPSGGTRGLSFGLRAGDLAIAVYRHRSHAEIDGGAAGPLQPALDDRLNPADIVVIPGYVSPAGGPDASTYRTDGAPVIAARVGEAVYIGDSTAALRLVVAEVLAPYLSASQAWQALHVHGTAGTPPTTPPPAAPTVEELAAGALRVRS